MYCLFGSLFQKGGVCVPVLWRDMGQGESTQFSLTNWINNHKGIHEKVHQSPLPRMRQLSPEPAFSFDSFIVSLTEVLILR